MILAWLCRFRVDINDTYLFYFDLLIYIFHCTRNIKTDFIGWVLTVPAIWSESAKGFMRKAAVQVSYFCV